MMSAEQDAPDGSAALCNAMRAAGVDPIPELIADGKPRHFPSPTDKHGRKSGWYILFSSGVSVLDSFKGDIQRQIVAPSGAAGKPSSAIRGEIERANRQAEAERER